MIGGINTVSVYGSGTIVHYCFVRGLSEVLEASLILVASSNKKIKVSAAIVVVLNVR